MIKQLVDIFKEEKSIKKIQKKLPVLFRMAELDSQRADKIGMEVGTIRERIIVSYFIYRFGKENVDANIPTTKPEVDVILFDQPISIKTMTGKSFSGVKLSWTVDAASAIRFINTYKPSCDIIFVRIHWDNEGYLYYIPKEVQLEVLNKISKESYLKMPKEGTNPRGVEITGEALRLLIEHKNTFHIKINWVKEKIEYNSFKRWVDLWDQE
jgi:hypothetical protein